MKALAIAGLVTAAGAAEALARRAESGLLPGLWCDEVLDEKHRQIRDLASRGYHPKVVAIGHSCVFDWMDPEEFRRVDPKGRSAYNAGVNFCVPALLRDWCRFVTSAWHPESVVLGLSSLDLNANGREQARVTALHEASAAGRSCGVLPKQGGLALMRQRRRVASRPFARAMKRGRDALPPAAHLIGPFGQDLHKVGRAYVCNDGFVTAFRERWLVDWAVGQRELRLIEDCIDIVKQSSARPVVVLAPCTSDFIALHPRGTADYEEAGVTIEGLCRRTGTRFLRVPAGMLPDELFADPVHLNDRGTRVMTRWLAEQDL